MSAVGDARKRRAFNTRVVRPAATLTLEHEHRWGTLISDTTSLRVTRSSAGRMEITYGERSMEIRAELVEVLAEMVATAAAWSDE